MTDCSPILSLGAFRVIGIELMLGCAGMFF